jgi:hypothetical protein
MTELTAKQIAHAVAQTLKEIAADFAHGRDKTADVAESKDKALVHTKVQFARRKTNTRKAR